MMDQSSPDFKIVDLNYVSVYVKDFQAAIDFYSRVFGPPENVEKEIYGWRMGATWLTLFPSKIGTEPDRNPCNAEFAIQMAEPEEVNRLYQALVAAGAKAGWEPKDSKMYEPMRFCYVDDPFGMRIDIYCPIDALQAGTE